MANKLYLHESCLSDGSIVYSITLPHLPLAAVTLTDAMELVDKVRRAIEMHTGEEVELVEMSEADDIHGDVDLFAEA